MAITYSQNIAILSNSCEQDITLRAILAFTAELFPDKDIEVVWQACL